MGVSSWSPCCVGALGEAGGLMPYRRAGTPLDFHDLWRYAPTPEIESACKLTNLVDATARLRGELQPEHLERAREAIAAVGDPLARDVITTELERIMDERKNEHGSMRSFMPDCVPAPADDIPASLNFERQRRHRNDDESPALW